MNQPIIQQQIYGLKCDTETCDFRDDSIQLSDYKHYINKACPKCGASLLTPEDYRAVQVITEAANMVQNLSPETLAKLEQEFLADLTPEQAAAYAALDPNQPAHVKFELNGTGEIRTEINIQTEPK